MASFQVTFESTLLARAGDGEHARSGAIDTAARVAGSLVGTGVVGEVVRGAVSTSQRTAESSTAPSDRALLPAPAGTAFFVFVSGA